MEPTAASRADGEKPFLTASVVHAEAFRMLQSGLAKFVPLAGLIIGAVTGFLYIVGIHTYDFFRDVAGLPVSAIQPSLNDILVRGAQASVPIGIVLLLCSALIVAALYGVFAWLDIKVEQRRLRLYREVLEDPSAVSSGSGIERRIKRRIKDLIATGWKPDVSAAAARIGRNALLSSLVLSSIFLAPLLIVGAQFVGYMGIYSDRFASLLFMKETQANRYEYITDRGTVCGTIIVEGEKGFAVWAASPTDGSLVVLRPEQVQRIKQVSACPLAQQ